MTYRVVQWGTGAVGVEAIRGILDHPDLELAGVKVYTDQKMGRDAGDLAGTAPVGIAAAKDVDTAGVDAVLYAPRTRRSTRWPRFWPQGPTSSPPRSRSTRPAWPPPTATGCSRPARRASSLHGTGLNPGNLGAVVPMALAGMSRSIEHVRSRNVPTGRCTTASRSPSTRCASAAR